MSAQLKIIDNITASVGEAFIPSRKRVKEPLNNFSAIETVLREGINPSPTSLNGPGFHEVSYKRRLGLKSGQSNQKRNIRVHRGDRRERREKK